MATTDIDRLLRESAPDVVVGPDVATAMRETARTVASGADTRPRRSGNLRAGRRRTRTLVAATAAALALAGGGVATAAVVLAAHTGWFTTPGSESDGTEWLDTSAPDFPAVAAELAPSGLPLPDGVTVEDATAQVVSQAQASPGLQQVTGVRAGYVFYAQCQWKRVWLDDRADARAAGAALESLADLPAFRTVDGGGLRAQELRIVADARAGDLSALRSDYRANCGGGLGDSPEAGR